MSTARAGAQGARRRRAASLIPDKRAKEADVWKVYDTGVADLIFAQTVLTEHPASVLVPPSRRFLADEIMDDPSDNHAELAPMRAITICGRPFALSPGQEFSFDLRVGDPVSEPTGLTAVLHGLMLSGVSG